MPISVDTSEPQTPAVSHAGGPQAGEPLTLAVAARVVKEADQRQHPSNVDLRAAAHAARAVAAPVASVAAAHAAAHLAATYLVVAAVMAAVMAAGAGAAVGVATTAVGATHGGFMGIHTMAILIWVMAMAATLSE